MVERPIAPSPGHPVRINLQTYSVDIVFSTLSIGVDNIHYDVFLSPRFVDFGRKYLLDLLRQTANAAHFYGMDAKSFRPPETSAFRKMLTDLLQAALTGAQFVKNIELDMLFRLALVKFLAQEIGSQFGSLILECKERIRGRGQLFERSEQGHVLNARLAELQADRRNIFRQVGQQVFGTLVELEDNVLSKSRRALFGNDFNETYELLKNRLVFVEGGRDDYLFLENYVLLGTFSRDPDRFEVFDGLLLEFLGDFVVADPRGEDMSAEWHSYDEMADKALSTRAELARLEEQRASLARELEGGGDLLSSLLRGRRDPAELRAGLADVEKRRAFLEERLASLAPQLETAKRKAEFFSEQYQGRLGDYVNQPENARRLFDPKGAGEEDREGAETRARLLEQWVSRLEQRGLLPQVLASYELRNLYLDFSPTVHLQQLKKALVSREEFKRVEEILKQFPARRFPLSRIEDLAKKLRRYPREEVLAVARRFAEDFMRLRRDLRNYQRLVGLMERVTLIQAEATRELSRVNNSLYEFLLPDESRPAEDRLVSHAVIKTDVRGSTRITQDLLTRGLNPASHFSLNLHEPVKRLLDRYGAAKVFIEGDAIILAIYETESNRGDQRAVAKACVLAREILTVSQSYNARAESSDLPRLELGVGVAFQNSPPTMWMDGSSRIMISKALNLSDRLSGCSKMARRLVGANPSPFNLLLFQTAVGATEEEEVDELLIRFNLNGVELNEEGFEKLSGEIALEPREVKCQMPWGEENVTLCVGRVPIGETLERIVVRKGVVRLLLPDGKIGGPGTHVYYEVCSNPRVLELLDAQPPG